MTIKQGLVISCFDSGEGKRGEDRWWSEEGDKNLTDERKMGPKGPQYTKANHWWNKGMSYCCHRYCNLL